MKLFELPGLVLRLRRVERELERLRRRVDLHLYARPYTSVPIETFAREYRRPDGPGFDYRGFESLFRDSEASKRLLEPYLEYFRGRRHVIDVGCGRGEFLELLREAGIEARGVDADEGMVACARDRQLEVVRADFMEFMSGLEDGSCDGIFSAQFIEHIPIADLDAFFRTAWRKLAPGGVIVCETVNPHHTAAFRFFYLDPTHVRPLFPELTLFMVVSAGFSDPRTVYVNFPGSDEDAYHECGEYAVVAYKR